MIIDFETRLIPKCLTKIQNYEFIVNSKILNHPSFKYCKKYLELSFFLEKLKKNNVDYICLRPLFWLSFNNQLENNFYLTQIDSHIIKFRAFGVPKISNKQELNIIINLLSYRKWDILEFIPSWQNYDISDKYYIELLDFANSLNIPCAIEIGQFYKNPINNDPAHKILDIVKLFPKLKIITPHFGGLLCWYELNKNLCTNLKNVYYVSSSFRSLGWINPILKNINHKKIIFGTDFPFIENTSHFDFYSETKGLPNYKLKSFYYENAINLFKEKI